MLLLRLPPLLEGPHQVVSCCLDSDWELVLLLQSAAKGDWRVPVKEWNLSIASCVPLMRRGLKNGKQGRVISELWGWGRGLLKCVEDCDFVGDECEVEFSLGSLQVQSVRDSHSYL